MEYDRPPTHTRGRVPRRRTGPARDPRQPDQRTSAVGRVGSSAQAPGHATSAGSRSTTTTRASSPAQPSATDAGEGSSGRVRPLSQTASSAPTPSSQTRVGVVMDELASDAWEGHTDQRNEAATRVPSATPRVRRSGRRPIRRVTRVMTTSSSDHRRKNCAPTDSGQKCCTGDGRAPAASGSTSRAARTQLTTCGRCTDDVDTDHVPAQPGDHGPRERRHHDEDDHRGREHPPDPPTDEP